MPTSSGRMGAGPFPKRRMARDRAYGGGSASTHRRISPKPHIAQFDNISLTIRAEMNHNRVGKPRGFMVVYSYSRLHEVKEKEPISGR